MGGYFLTLPRWAVRQRESVSLMLADVLIAIVIVAIAAVLGLVVHPLLWFIAVLAILVLVGRHHGGRRSGTYV